MLERLHDADEGEQIEAGDQSADVDRASQRRGERGFAQAPAGGEDRDREQPDDLRRRDSREGKHESRQRGQGCRGQEKAVRPAFVAVVQQGRHDEASRRQGDEADSRMHDCDGGQIGHGCALRATTPATGSAQARMSRGCTFAKCKQRVKQNVNGDAAVEGRGDRPHLSSRGICHCELEPRPAAVPFA
jgi:hypothetical protein